MKLIRNLSFFLIFTVQSQQRMICNINHSKKQLLSEQQFQGKNMNRVLSLKNYSENLNFFIIIIRMQIRVLGVPQTGAKSRVETQIKLCIQLVTDDGDKAQWWSHLKLPEHMVAKDKLKRQVLLSTAPNGAKIASVAGMDCNNASIKPEKMLFLSARVICASDPSRKVVTCLGCIQREVISTTHYFLLTLLNHIIILCSVRDLNVEKRTK